MGRRLASVDKSTEMPGYPVNPCAGMQSSMETSSRERMLRSVCFSKRLRSSIGVARNLMTVERNRNKLERTSKPISTPTILAPSFSYESAVQRVRFAEDARNSRDPNRVALAYTEDSIWRNRDELITGRHEIRAFLTGKRARELDYRLAKSLWTFADNRIAVRIQYEWHDATNNWFRSYRNELWEFDSRGLMARREASINSLRIQQRDRKFHRPTSGPRPADDPDIADIR